jgi:DNA-binding NtrC family response regulator
MDVAGDSQGAGLTAVARHTQRHAPLTQPRDEAINIVGRFLKGDHPLMMDLRSRIVRHVAGRRPLLITGETGTGKQLAARALHAAGPLRNLPLVIASAGALPLSLAQSELFGHRRGSFTGAERDRKGLFLQARGSTLVLDDVPDYSLALQAMLLNAVEYGLLRPVGGDTDEFTDARVVATSNRSLPMAVAGGTFREDLYYRLSAGEIRIPPLRDHPSDIPIYVRDLLSCLARETPGERKDLSDGALGMLQEHPWPGNVRELQNVVTRAYYSTDADLLRAEQIMEAFLGTERPPSSGMPAVQEEETRIRRALRDSSGNVSRAARALGIGRTRMYELQRKYGIVRT